MLRLALGLASGLADCLTHPLSVSSTLLSRCMVSVVSPSVSLPLGSLVSVHADKVMGAHDPNVDFFVRQYVRWWWWWWWWCDGVVVSPVSLSLSLSVSLFMSLPLPPYITEPPIGRHQDPAGCPRDQQQSTTTNNINNNWLRVHPANDSRAYHRRSLYRS